VQISRLYFPYLAVVVLGRRYRLAFCLPLSLSFSLAPTNGIVMGKNTKRNKKTKQQQQQPQQNGVTASASGTAVEDFEDQQAASSLPSLNGKKRSQLNKLVEELLNLVEKQPANPNEEWKQYGQLQELLKQIMILEEPLSQAVCPQISDSPDDQTRLAKVSSLAEEVADCPKLKTLRLEENCLQAAAFTPKILKDSKICNLAVDGNLFNSKQFTDLDGYDVYMERYTAVRKKMF